jgi:hypothetical protein
MATLSPAPVPARLGYAWYVVGVLTLVLGRLKEWTAVNV